MNNELPSTNGTNGQIDASHTRIDARASGGKFAKGNPGGPGNPFGRRVATLRSVLVDAVSEDDIRGIATELVKSAKGGDLAAVKLLLGYLIGTPTPAPDPDRLATDEAILESELWRAKAQTRIQKPSKFDSILDGL